MPRHGPSRRAVLQAGVGSAALAGLAAACSSGPPLIPQTDQAAGVYEFNQGWLFGGVFSEGCTDPGFDDSGFAQVTLPHTVAPLSWRDWDPATWQNIWIYRRHFDGTALQGGRAFIDFDGVMTNAIVVLNGQRISAHQGGYLPWSAELTRHMVQGNNVLAVVLDSRWLSVPPGGGDRAANIDFLQPGGIYRDVRLRVVPEAFIADVFAKPVDVLTPARSVELAVTIDTGSVRGVTLQVAAELLDGTRSLASSSAEVPVGGSGPSAIGGSGVPPGQQGGVSTGGTVSPRNGTAAKAVTTAHLKLTGIGDVTLWSPDTPRLYTVQVTLSGLPDGATHSYLTRIGFREARFKLDGFYLNGRRLTLFGLNRHQLFPFVGMAVPERLQRKDAEILKNQFNCNMVRCSHYPQSPHFLDACDELGLMVWEEPPGWRYIGATSTQQLIARDVQEMVVRDRNHPCVIIWGTRVNETGGHADLYRRTAQIAQVFDGTRQTSGSMRVHSTLDWNEDVFAFDDYHVDHEGNATLLPPLPGVPYLVTEAVGTLDGVKFFRWTDPGWALAKQAVMHAQVHEIAQSDDRYAGLLGWTGFDYASLHGHTWDNVKWPGVCDTFRVAKPGAAFYRSQVDPRVEPVIIPVFFWDFEPDSGTSGSQQTAMIATNCDRLEIFVGGLHAMTATPDTSRFGHLAHPPVFADLAVNPVFVDLIAGGTGLPDLRIDGYVRGRHLATARMSADTSKDRLVLTADDAAITADGSDATRVTFRALDAYGNQRRYVTGGVDLSLQGSGVLVGDNPFAFGEYGGVGGAFIRSVPGKTGLVTLTAAHATLGRATLRIRVTPPSADRRFL